MSLIDPWMAPGMGVSVETNDREFLWGNAASYQYTNALLAAATVDATNTPTTQLRRGLLLGRITASGLYTHYDPAATDGSEVAQGFLADAVNMLDRTSGAAAIHVGRLVFMGLVKAGFVLGLDEQARRQLNNRFVFDDRLSGVPGGPLLIAAKAADYTVVNGTDNGKWFTTQGAAGAVVFTLPTTLARGNVWRFINEVNQNMTVAAPANKLVVTNNATATSIAFSTANLKIGSVVEISTNADATKYVAHLLTTNTATIA